MDVRARGGVRISFSWKVGSVEVCVLRMATWHPWMEGLRREVALPGYFRYGHPPRQEQERTRQPPEGERAAGGRSKWVSYKVLSPNDMFVLGRGILDEGEKIAVSSSSSGDAQRQWRLCATQNGDSFLAKSERRLVTVPFDVDTSDFPCFVVLCDRHQQKRRSAGAGGSSDEHCWRVAKSLLLER